MNVGQALGVGVAGHYDVRLFGQQRLEGIEELFLRALLVGKELHIVDQQQIQRVVALFELVKSFGLSKNSLSLNLEPMSSSLFRKFIRPNLQFGGQTLLKVF